MCGWWVRESGWVGVYVWVGRWVRVCLYGWVGERVCVVLRCAVCRRAVVEHGSLCGSVGVIYNIMSVPSCCVRQCRCDI